MATNLIHSQKIVDIQPLRCYSEPVYKKYNTLKELLKSEISNDYYHLLLEPSISKESLKGNDEGLYFSHIYKNLKPLTSFSNSAQKELLKNLNIKIDKILELSQVLLESENKDSNKLGEFLKSSIEVPSLDYVYSDGKNVVLAFWGFKSITIEHRDFKLSSAVRGLENNVENDESIEKAKVPNTDKKSYKKLFFALFAILLSTLIAFLLYFFMDKNELKFEPSKVKIDEKSPLKEKIITNRIMLILKEKVEIEKFITKLKVEYPAIKLIESHKEFNTIECEIDEKKRIEIMESLKKLEEVAEVFSENIISNSYIPNDSGFGDSKKKWLFEAINTYQGWEITKGKKEVVIAIIDSSFDLTHPELRDKIVSPWNAGDNTARLSQNSNDFHGTHVASLAVGKIDNGLGTGGICPECSFMPIQLSQDGFKGFSTSALIRAFKYAVQNRADVINMSLGTAYGVNFSLLSLEQKKVIYQVFKKTHRANELLWKRMYRYARVNNIVVVTAAGNSDMFTGIDPMKRDESIINVTAINQNLEKADFSNFGDFVTLTAPGVEIYGAVPNNRFKFLQGTSMASPIVAGLVGLLKSQNRSYSPQLIKKILIETGKNLPNISNKIGRLVQVDLALKEIEKNNELERVKKELEECREKGKKLIIPTTPTKNFTFAKGLWKSSTNIYEYDMKNSKIIEEKPIEIFFQINATGDGIIKLKKVNGDFCIGDIKLSFSKNRLNITQTTPAICQKDAQQFKPYIFECKADSGRVASCQTIGTHNFKFELIKYK